MSVDGISAGFSGGTVYASPLRERGGDVDCLSIVDIATYLTVYFYVQNNVSNSM